MPPSGNAQRPIECEHADCRDLGLRRERLGAMRSGAHGLRETALGRAVAHKGSRFRCFHDGEVPGRRPRRLEGVHVPGLRRLAVDPHREGTRDRRRPRDEGPLRLGRPRLRRLTGPACGDDGLSRRREPGRASPPGHLAVDEDRHLRSPASPQLRRHSCPTHERRRTRRVPRRDRGILRQAPSRGLRALLLPGLVECHGARQITPDRRRGHARTRPSVDMRRFDDHRRHLGRDRRQACPDLEPLRVFGIQGTRPLPCGASGDGGRVEEGRREVHERHGDRAEQGCDRDLRIGGIRRDRAARGPPAARRRRHRPACARSDPDRIS